MTKSDLETLIPLLIGTYRKISREPGPSDKLQTREFRKIVADLKKLHDGPYDLNENEFLLPYLLYDYVVHYQQGLSLIGELPLPPRRVLDIGAGAMPFSLAAMKSGAREVIGLDQADRALEIGTEIAGRMGYPASKRKWVYPKEIPVEGQFDLIIVGHSLLEISPQNPDKFLDTLFKKLTPDGFLLIVDSSENDINRKFLELRDRMVHRGIPVQAPCVWRGDCPALKSRAPCYAQRAFEKPHVIKEIQRASQINLSSLKMTYLIFRSPEAEWPEPAVTPCWRVISPPIEAFHSQMYYLCGTDGKRTLSSHLSEHPKEARAFEYIKRGELISFTNALEKQNSIEIIEGTEVRVEAAVGKPLKTKEGL